MNRFLKFLFYAFVAFFLFALVGGLYRFIFPDESDIRGANIAVIEIDGVITDSLSVLEQIDEIRKNPQLKAVVVRVDTPGGAVGASQEIYMELKKLRATHPVVVSMGDLAASGGLYVSISGDVILALPGTLTGSMGVLLELTNFSRLMERLYIDAVTLKSGELKDAGNPTRPLDPKAKEYFQGLILNTFKAFRKSVQEERKLSNSTIQMLSDGRVIDGNQAVELHLADQIGTFLDAVRIAKDKAKIKGEAHLAWLSRKPKSFMEKLLRGASEPIRRWVRSQTRILEYRLDPYSPPSSGMGR